MNAIKEDAKFGEPSPEDVQGSGRRLRTRREQTTLYYRLSAILFIGGGISGIPPDLLQAPQNSSAILILPVIAIVSAIITWVVSDRAPRAGLHVVAVVATLEVSLSVAFVSSTFAVYFVFIA